MSITIYSPYNSRPVEVREQDVGRAVKDSDGRTFYVIAKSDGTGYYGAMTRMGGQKDEDRAMEIEFKVSRGQGRVDEEFEAAEEAPRRRGSNRGTIVVIVFLAIVGGMVWAMKAKVKDSWQKGPEANPIVLEGGKPAKTTTAGPTGGAVVASASAAPGGKYDPYAPLPAIPDGNIVIAPGSPIDSAPVTPGLYGMWNHGAPIKGPATPDGATALGPGKQIKSAPSSAPSTANIPAPKK